MSDLANAARVWQLNFLFSTEVLTDAASEIEALGLEPKEFFVLDGIPDRPYPADLSRHLSIAKPSITLFLKKLQAKGLIDRVIDPDDLRRHRLAPTRTGLVMLDRARKILVKHYAERLRRLSPKEQEEFSILLLKLTA